MRIETLQLDIADRRRINNLISATHLHRVVMILERATAVMKRILAILLLFGTVGAVLGAECISDRDGDDASIFFDVD